MYDPVRQKLYALDAGLLRARAYHTATLLPDGQVLVRGGEDKDGTSVTTAELFDPEKATFHVLDNLGLIARTHYGATLLVDGRVLITGGSDGEGNTLAYKVTPTEGGLIAFIRPMQELLPSANYTLVVRGAV